MFWPLAEVGEEWVQLPLCRRFPCSHGRRSNTGQLANKGYLATRVASCCPLCQKLQGRKGIHTWACPSPVKPCMGPQEQGPGMGNSYILAIARVRGNLTRRYAQPREGTDVAVWFLKHRIFVPMGYCSITFNF